MEKIYLPKDSIVSIDAIRHDVLRYKAQLCDAFENIAMLVDMIGSVKDGANDEVRGYAWQVIKTLADYSGLIGAIVDGGRRIVFTESNDDKTH